MLLSDTFGITLTSQMRHQALWKLRTQFGTNKALAKKLRISQALCGKLVNLQYVPGRQLRKKIEPRLAKLGFLADDLWPKELIQSGIIGSKHLKRAMDKDVTFEEMASLSSRELLQLPDDRHHTDDAIALQDKKIFIEALLKRLHPRNAHILRLRFGMEDGEAHTRNEIADMLDLTPVRIAQVEKNCLRKLRHIKGASKVYANDID